MTTNISINNPLVPAISCLCFNKDHSLCALSPANSEIHIYETHSHEDYNEWTLRHILTEHSSYITAIDWAPNSNKLLSCSQDKNCFVWEFHPFSSSPSSVTTFNEGEWKPIPVLISISKSATCCKWSPDESRFAVGSSCKSVCVCYYDPEMRFYFSKRFRQHKSTVTCLAWHPNDSTLLLTGSSDMRSRLFKVPLYSLDSNKKSNAQKRSAFGECLTEFTSKGWLHDVKFSPSGQWIALIAHDSTVQFVDISQLLSSLSAGNESASCQIVRHSKLPFSKGLFISDHAFIAVGHDFVPYAFTLQQNKWILQGCCDNGKSSLNNSVVTTTNSQNNNTNNTQSGSTVKDLLERMKIQNTIGIQNFQNLNMPTTRHYKTITSICSIERNNNLDSTKVCKFSTGALDGKVVFWDVKELSNMLGQIQI